MSETRGEMRDRQRELRSLDTIAAALAISHLQVAKSRVEADDGVGLGEPARSEHLERRAKAIERLDERIAAYEATLGVPREARTGAG